MTSDVPERLWSPETLELAKKAAESNEAENRKLAAMTPPERAAYISEWARRLAEESVAIGERGVGCTCCDPDVQAKLPTVKQEKPFQLTTVRTMIPNRKCKLCFGKGNVKSDHGHIPCSCLKFLI
jgi:hypothetical protein